MVDECVQGKSPFAHNNCERMQKQGILTSVAMPEAYMLGNELYRNHDQKILRRMSACFEV